MSETGTIDCGSCGAGNRSGRAFCAACGAALPVACVACGFANAAGDNFCGGCGKSMASIVPAPAPPLPAADAGERRPITVLFADLVEFTKLSQEHDPEDVHRLLGRYFDVVDEIIERFGGSVDKHIGDSVMAVFGAPIAHGDDVTRALRAAIEIRHAVPLLGAELGKPLAVHIGVASGEVMASGLGSSRHHAYTVIGNPVNLAARLLALAGPGEIVLDDAVRTAAGDLVHAMPLKAVAVKGIAAPVRAWRLTGLAEVAGLEHAQAFVGRVRELAQLAAVLHGVAESGSGTGVHVRGEAGIGKSRLVAEFRQRAVEAGFGCHAGLVLDFGIGKGRDAVREIVASLVELAPTALSEERQAAVARTLESGCCAREQEPFLCDLLDVAPDTAGRTLYEAMDTGARQRGRSGVIGALLRAAAQVRPRLLIVEDLHWADQATLDHLEALLREAAALPVVVAMTSRPEGDPLDRAWRSRLQSFSLVTLDLAPLRPEEALLLAGGLVSASRQFAQKCIERAAGNPLFLEQLLRSAEDRDDALPASLHSLVLARMDRLPERDRAALRAAATLGQRFSVAALAAVASLPGYDCGALIAHRLVRPEGEEYLFAHALIRDGVYASLTRGRRSELHRAAAQWFSEHDLALTAEHLDRADAPQAPQAYLVAARATAAEFALERALELAARGAELARDSADAVALNLLLGELQRESGDGRLAVSAYRAAEAVATHDADRCRALIGVAAGHRLTARLDDAMVALAQAEPLARRNGLVRELAEIHYTRGNLHFARGEIAACRTEHEAAMLHARTLGDPEWEARAASGLADADYASGHMRTALSHFQHCVELCDAHGLVRIALANRMMAGHCRSYLLEFDAAAADMGASLRDAIRFGNRHTEMLMYESLGMLYMVFNRHAEAEPLLAKGIAQAEALDARRYLATMLGWLAETYAYTGRREAARPLVERALALARETGFGFCGPTILGVKALLLDDPGEAARCRAEAQAALLLGCLSHNHLSFHRYCIEDALGKGHWNDALAHADALAAYTRDEPLPYTDFLIARARTLAALHRGPDDPAALAELARLQGVAAGLNWPLAWPGTPLAQGATARSGD